MHVELVGGVGYVSPGNLCASRLLLGTPKGWKLDHQVSKQTKHFGGGAGDPHLWGRGGGSPPLGEGRGDPHLCVKPCSWITEYVHHGDGSSVLLMVH